MSDSLSPQLAYYYSTRQAVNQQLVFCKMCDALLEYGTMRSHRCKTLKNEQNLTPEQTKQCFDEYNGPTRAKRVTCPGCNKVFSGSDYTLTHKCLVILPETLACCPTCHKWMLAKGASLHQCRGPVVMTPETIEENRKLYVERLINRRSK
jgi:hypothetical protein